MYTSVGEWPHAAERVTALPSGVKRVILGFNVFSRRVAEVNQRAPEHSPQFNATVKLYQAASKTRAAAPGGLSVASLLQNKPLARFFVGLARAQTDAAPSAPALWDGQVGDAVLARWRTGIRWWKALVVARKDDGSLVLHYDDGTKWEDAPRSAVRPLS